jgi:ABC-type thiamine transport system ATPase subunit
MLNTTSVPELEADRTIVAEWQARLPELLSGTDDQLIAAARALMDPPPAQSNA